MNKKRSMLLIVGLVFLCSKSTYSAEKTTPIRVACVGDSITFGAEIKDRKKNCYPSQLATMLGSNWTVRNFGVSGSRLLKKGHYSYWERKPFQEALEFNPNIVIIKLGTNDLRPWENEADFVPDYIDMIKHFQELPSKPIVRICTITPTYPGSWGHLDHIITEKVIPLIYEVAEKANVKIIDLNSALSNKPEMFPDSVHPNALGAKLMAKVIHAEIISEKSKNTE